MVSGDYDLVVPDEVNIALRYDYLSVDTVIDALESRSVRPSVILTGRDGKQNICDYADLVSEMREIKHPYKRALKLSVAWIFNPGRQTQVLPT